MGAVIKAFERVRPGRRFVPPATSINLSKPGDIIKFTFLVTVSLEQIFRFSSGWPYTQQFVSMKTTADVHVAFGPSAARRPGELVDPTNADLLLQPGDSWQDFQIDEVDEAFKVKGDLVGGDFYLLLSGR